MASAENGPSPPVAASSGDISSRSPAAAQKPPLLAELKVRVAVDLVIVVKLLFFGSFILTKIPKYE